MILVLFCVKFCLMDCFAKFLAIVKICIQTFFAFAYLMTFFFRFYSFEPTNAIASNSEIASDISRIVLCLSKCNCRPFPRTKLSPCIVCVKNDDFNDAFLTVFV